LANQFLSLDVLLKPIMQILSRAENAARKAAGEEPLPEDDASNPAFKPIPEPSRLDGFLITNQISNYCGQING
jgi:translation initiation factor 3 subunit H